MNRLRLSSVLRALLWCLLLLPLTGRADIVYPARLELRETEPGIFEVYFVLPVIQGKVLKAEPVFPEFCKPLQEPEISGDEYVKEMRWVITCEPGQLYGQTIGINGLLGSQINIILLLKTLEGRTYSTTLNPAAAWFEIPYPPGATRLLKEGLLNGARIPVTEMAFFVLLFILVYRGTYKGTEMVTLFTLSITAGLVLGYLEWLKVPGWWFEMSTFLLSFLLILDRYISAIPAFSPKNLLLPLITSLVFLGGSYTPKNTPDGFTGSEKIVLMLWTLMGIALGVALIYALIKQAFSLLALLPDRFKGLKNGIAIAAGAVSAGLLIFTGSLLWKTPSLFPPIPLLLWTATLIAITSQLKASEKPTWLRILPILIPFLLGIGIGFAGITIPYSTEITLATGWILLISRAFPPLNSAITAAIPGSIFGLGSGMALALYCEQHLSYPIARTLEFAAMVIFSGSLVYILLNGISNKIQTASYKNRLSGILTALAILLSGIMILSKAGFSLDGIHLQQQLRIPLISIALLLTGLFLWPRQKRVHKDLGVSARKPVASLLCFGVALCCLSVKTGIQNPWFSTADLDREEVQAVMQQILSNTYNAFNLEDEERLFEALSANVEEGLLDNIYLDSRRRLTMGLREGSEVRVEDVKIDLLGAPETPSGNTALSYPATWTVTARVKHLKHIHYRRNRYMGTIEMKTVNDSWKISKIILNSEEREVIPAATL